MSSLVRFLLDILKYNKNYFLKEEKKERDRERGGDREGNFCDDIVYDRVMEGMFIQRRRRRR